MPFLSIFLKFADWLDWPCHVAAWLEMVVTASTNQVWTKFTISSYTCSFATQIQIQAVCGPNFWRNLVLFLAMFWYCESLGHIFYSLTIICTPIYKSKEVQQSKVSTKFLSRQSFLRYCTHGSYELIIMLEKCGHLDLTVFHLIWVIGT